MEPTDQQEVQTSSTTTKAKDAPKPDTTPTAKRPVEEHLAGLPLWQQAAIKASLNKPHGFEMTAEDFQKAADAALNEVVQ